MRCADDDRRARIVSTQFMEQRGCAESGDGRIDEVKLVAAGMCELNGVIRRQREVDFVLVQKLRDQMPRFVVRVHAKDAAA